MVLISDCAEKDFVGANLVQVLHKLLTDEHSAPEIKYNSMILICSIMGSGESRDHRNKWLNTFTSVGTIEQKEAWNYTL